MVRALARVHRRHLLFLFVCLALGLPSGKNVSAEESLSITGSGLLVQAVLEFKDALEIPNDIDVLIVEKNDLLFSATRQPQNNKAFRITCERQFLDSLTVSELRAAVAHEMGHIWIFTHHPYLQTEELADEIAGRVVNKTDLEGIHSKTQTYLAKRKPILGITQR